MAVILFLILLIVALVVLPGLWVRKVLVRYGQPIDRYAETGEAVARRLLDAHGLDHVAVEHTDGGDHYDPTTRTIRLTPDNFKNGSLTAVTVAAHEVGHAIQDAEGYAPLRLRTRLVQWAIPLERLGAGVLMVTPIVAIVTRVPWIGVVALVAGFLTLATSAVVHLITLPTEFDASFARALPLLDRHGIIKAEDRPHARKLLKAAALTYVSASLMSLLNVARWWAILRR